jgi:hypothetical protein
MTEKSTMLCTGCMTRKPGSAFWVEELQRVLARCDVCRGADAAGLQLRQPTKHCPGCEKTKPTTDFWRNTLAADGLTPQCKECITGRKRQLEDEHRAKMKAARKENEATSLANLRRARAEATFGSARGIADVTATNFRLVPDLALARDVRFVIDQLREVDRARSSR